MYHLKQINVVSQYLTRVKSQPLIQNFGSKNLNYFMSVIASVHIFLRHKENVIHQNLFCHANREVAVYASDTVVTVTLLSLSFSLLRST